MVLCWQQSLHVLSDPLGICETTASGVRLAFLRLMFSTIYICTFFSGFTVMGHLVSWFLLSVMVSLQHQRLVKRCSASLFQVYILNIIVSV